MNRTLDSDLTGLSFAAHHTGRPMPTPDDVRSLAPHLELLFLAGQRPILAQKLRYFADGEFQGLTENFRAYSIRRLRADAGQGRALGRAARLSTPLDRSISVVGTLEEQFKHLCCGRDHLRASITPSGSKHFKVKSQAADREIDDFMTVPRSRRG